MNSVRKNKATTTSKTAAARRDRRILAKARRQDGAEKPVSQGIKRAAERAGIEPTHDSTRVTAMRGDLELAVSEVGAAFEEIFEAEVFTTEAEHDHLVMCALRRLRNVQNLLGVELQPRAAGGAS